MIIANIIHDERYFGIKKNEFGYVTELILLYRL